MGTTKGAPESWDAAALAGDSPEEMIDSMMADLRSWPSLLRMYAYNFAAAIALFYFAAAMRDYRIALVGAGAFIRPAATWVALSEAPGQVKAAVRMVTRPLRLIFVGYCVYLAVTALGG